MKFFAMALLAALPALAADPVSDKGKTLGSPGAAVRLDLYSDFTCPHCKLMHEQILPKIVSEYITSGKAYLVFHEFTLTGPGHEHSREASTWAAAAARIGRYQQVSDVLFQQQVSWAVSGKVWDAVSSALTPPERIRMQALVKDPSVTGEVQRDLEMGNAAHVNSTPTMIIRAKGKQTPWAYWSDYPLFRSFLNDQLK